MKKLIVATNNKGKLSEIKQLLGDKFDILSLADAGVDIDPTENGETFFDNALIKAKAVYDIVKCPVISDDSGLCVDALNDAPGVYSARYAGEGHNDELNNQKILDEMSGVENRAAKFVSVVVYFDGENTISGYGECLGKILYQTEGNGGFGYDPIFFSLALNKSFGKATAEEKNKVSHRAAALSDLISKLNK